MAWIESHQELRHHYKTKRLARELKVKVAAAVGHLHFLWWWAIDFAPDGNLSKFDDYEIADAIGYEGKDPSKAKAALISAGFLDNNECGTLTIHDWNEYAGRTLGQREKARQRAKNYREKQSAQVAESVPQAVAQREPGESVPKSKQTDCGQVPYANATHTVQETNENGTGIEPIACASTEHNSTEHNNTLPENTITPPIPSQTGKKGDATQTGLTESRFEEFWALYPKKQGKGAALKAWRKIKPDKEFHAKILAAVKENTEHNQQWQRDGGQYIPNPTTWLNQTRWLDTIPDGQRGGAVNAAGRNAGFNNQRIGGADSPAEFQRSTGFRSADSGTEAES